MTTAQPRRLVAGISVPDAPSVDRAIQYARRSYEPYLFNHAMRSWLFAVRTAQIRELAHDEEVVAIGTILHDLTLTSTFSGPRRFEVEAADQVREFALSVGLDQRRCQLVWDGVALNSTPSIGLHKEAEVMLCTTGICLDVVGFQYGALDEAEIDIIVDTFPRLDMKHRMTRCFCNIAENCPSTSYDNFLRDFGERFVPGYKAPSAVDLVASAPFAE